MLSEPNWRSAVRLAGIRRLIWTVTLNPALDHVYRLPSAGGDAPVAEETSHQPAGKGLNVARALSALGARSVAVSLVDRASAPAFRDILLGLGAVPRLLPVLPRTRQHASLLMPGGMPALHVREAGASASPSALSWIQDALSDCRPGDHVALCGSLAPGLPVTVYADLARRLTCSGVAVWVDTSGQPLVHALKASPYGVKVNAEEASQALGRSVTSPAEAASAVRHLAEGETPLACLTLGRRGLVLAYQAQVVYAPCAAVEAGSPVGSGDAALAALLVGIAHGQDARHLAAAAAAAGAANARSAVPGAISLATYHDLLAKTLAEVRPMND